VHELHEVTQLFLSLCNILAHWQVAEGHMHAGDASKSLGATTGHSQELVQEIEAEEAHIQLDQLGIDSLDALCTQLFTLLRLVAGLQAVMVVHLAVLA
jgi:hypothetical protein